MKVRFVILYIDLKLFVKSITKCLFIKFDYNDQSHWNEMANEIKKKITNKIVTNIKSYINFGDHII